MRIAIGSDKSGFSLKESVKAYLVEHGYIIEDLGLTDPEGFKAFYEVAPCVARKVQSGEVDKGLLFCGTGMGMAIAANKFKGVYAAAVESSYSARMCAVINRANILTMGGWIIAPQMAVEMVEKWLNTGFTEGFPLDRQKFLCDAFEHVKEIEDENMK